ncbi:MAG: hypothetical protein ABIW16_00025 [Sphingomicrobium sp.]
MTRIFIILAIVLVTIIIAWRRSRSRITTVDQQRTHASKPGDRT